jgi:hypothetical protein
MVWPRSAKAKREAFISEDKLLLSEIKKAHMEWVVAQKRFDFVTEKDQIDYAIYAMEAAEKRYEMLLRQAKRLKLTASQ